MISRDIPRQETGMRLLKAFSFFLVATALHNAAWAEIYETRDAEGNPEFSDTPSGPNAEVIELQQTNIVDAPPAEPQQDPAQQTVVDEQAPAQQDRTVIIHDANNDEDDVYEDDLRREREFERLDPAAPDEVLDGEAPREVGDSDAQMPRETGDADPLMSREDADLSAEERNVSAGERRIDRH